MACSYYTFKGGMFSGDYWCTKKDCRISDDVYYKYCRDYNYSACPIYKYNESSGCFITTVACQILGKKDNDVLLQNFRKFRDNILQPSEQYHSILKDYDRVGPAIADCIANDKDKEKVALGIYQKALMPINTKINNQEYDEAVAQYYLMTLCLVNYYGLNHEYSDIVAKQYKEEFCPKTAGHGLRKVK